MKSLICYSRNIAHGDGGDFSAKQACSVYYASPSYILSILGWLIDPSVASTYGAVQALPVWKLGSETLVNTLHDN